MFCSKQIFTFIFLKYLHNVNNGFYYVLANAWIHLLVTLEILIYCGIKNDY